MNQKHCKIFYYEPCKWVLLEYTQKIVFELLKIRSTGGAVHANYIFKCGLHCLAIFKLFQRIMLHLQPKNFFTFKLYRTLQWSRFFFSLMSRIISSILKLATQWWDAIKIPQGFANLVAIYEKPKPFS